MHTNFPMVETFPFSAFLCFCALGWEMKSLFFLIHICRLEFENNSKAETKLLQVLQKPIILFTWNILWILTNDIYNGDIFSWNKNNISTSMLNKKDTISHTHSIYRFFLQCQKDMIQQKNFKQWVVALFSTGNVSETLDKCNPKIFHLKYILMIIAVAICAQIFAGPNERTICAHKFLISHTT